MRMRILLGTLRRNWFCIQIVPNALIYSERDCLLFRITIITQPHIFRQGIASRLEWINRVFVYVYVWLVSTIAFVRLAFACVSIHSICKLVSEARVSGAWLSPTHLHSACDILFIYISLVWTKAHRRVYADRASAIGEACVRVCVRCADECPFVVRMRARAPLRTRAHMEAVKALVSRPASGHRNEILLRILLINNNIFIIIIIALVHTRGAGSEWLVSWTFLCHK